MSRSWRFRPHDTAAVTRLAGELGVAPLTAQVLIARGVTDRHAAEVFLGGKLTDLVPPADLPGVPEAAERIADAVRAGRRVTVWGDYDVDGMTASAILLRCLKLHGADADFHVPCRLADGYGLNADKLRELAAEDADRLVVTVDCGIASVAEADLARDLGLELVVTDHHTPGPTLPAAAAVVHPDLPDNRWPDRHPCGAGVAFRLAWELCRRLAEEGDGVGKLRPAVRDFLTYDAVTLAAIGTVADVVPLVGENRLVVRYGLRTLAARPNAGLKALMQVAGVDPSNGVSTEDVGFQIGPRLNAAGRLGQARLGVELLTTDDADRAEHLAGFLDTLNGDRKRIEQRVVREAKERFKAELETTNPPAVVLADADWHPGVIGIAAGRLAERFERPAVLIALDENGAGQGSGRSYNGFDLHAGLAAAATHLDSFGGHKAAAGVRVRAENVDAFRDAFCEHVADATAGHDPDAAVDIDAEILLDELTPAALRELDRLGPFGAANPKPGFVATNLTLAEQPRGMGEGGRHLSARFKQFRTEMRAVAFGRGEWVEELAAADGPLDAYFAVELNRWQGRERVELRLLDWRPSTVPAAVT